MYSSYPSARSRGGSSKGRLIFAAIIAIMSLVSYFGSRQDNPVTGETQYIGITVDQEIALGLQAAPQMAQEFGGEDPDQAAQALVDQIGNSIVQSSAAGQTLMNMNFTCWKTIRPSMPLPCPVGRSSLHAPYSIDFRLKGNWLEF